MKLKENESINIIENIFDKAKYYAYAHVVINDGDISLEDAIFRAGQDALEAYAKEHGVCSGCGGAVELEE